MIFKEMDPMLRRLIIHAIRSWFPRTEKYKTVKEAVKRYSSVYKKDGTLSKKKAVDYKCNVCKDYFKGGEVEVDHITEIIGSISSTNDMTVSQYIKRVDCSIGNLQVICKVCHKKKTKEFNKTRTKRDKLGKVLKTRKKAIKKPHKLTKLKI